MLIRENQFRRLAVLTSVLFLAAAHLPAADNAAAKRFAQADADGDKKISLDEFLKLPGEQAVLRRDFRLFDFDGDQVLSREEFDALPLGRPAAERGALPDPLRELVERALAQVDEVYEHWDENPQKRIAVQEFLQNYLLSFPDPNSAARNTAALIREADEDQDRRISRDEAHRFLEIQFGVRRSEGELLRFPNGQVVSSARFLEMDKNADDRIDRQEFLTHWTGRDWAADWKLLDRNADGNVSFAEFQSPAAQIGLEDPVEQFRQYDANLDALLDADELQAASPGELRNFAAHAFPAFDLDRDGKLNLREYRLLPQAIPVLPWQVPAEDRNRDELLQFSEFAAQGSRFPLLRLVLFTRLDRNRSGTLDQDEFSFKTLANWALYRMQADGSDRKIIFTSDNYPVVGSPKISRDGQWLLCDAEEKGKGNNRKMLLMTIDGKDLRDLGPGMMPTWSSDGKEIAFSRSGVQIMDLVTNHSRTVAGAGAWSGQWSPDGEKIAFTLNANIKLYHVNRQEVTSVWEEMGSPYQQIFWNFGWSPDSRQICFKGIRKGGGPELASVTVDDPPRLTVHYHGNRPFANNFAWSPDGRRIVFGMHIADLPLMALHEINPHDAAVPVLLKGPDPAWQSQDACWSPDGKFLIFDGSPD